MQTICFQPLFPDVVAPQRATYGSAGYDLRANLTPDRRVVLYTPCNERRTLTLTEPSVALWPGERAMVPLGFKAQLPDGYYMAVVPRSGKSLQLGLSIVNAPGTIDWDYPNEWMVLVRNDSLLTLTIAHNDAIAQGILSRYHVLPIVEGIVTPATERVGGFGSTGQ